ncbi:MAG: hypothetical protein SO253_04555 [Bacilli bacterium]|nr:hypothetical protein [Bacilli bacterium]
MKYCKKCNKYFVNKASYCSKCGEKLVLNVGIDMFYKQNQANIKKILNEYNISKNVGSNLLCISLLFCLFGITFPISGCLSLMGLLLSKRYSLMRLLNIIVNFISLIICFCFIVDSNLKGILINFVGQDLTNYLIISTVIIDISSFLYYFLTCAQTRKIENEILLLKKYLESDDSYEKV